MSQSKEDPAFSGEPPDILVPNKILRNRALHKDEVCLRVFPPSKWMQPIDKYSEEEDLADDANQTAQPLQPTAEVVFIFSNERGRTIVCTLKPNFSPNTASSEVALSSSPQLVSTSDNYIRAVPIDHRIPWILLRTAEVSKFLVPRLTSDTDQTFECPENSYFRVKIVHWNDWAPLPLGEIHSYIGDGGSYEAEEQAALNEVGMSGHMKDATPMAEEQATDIAREYEEHWDQIITGREMLKDEIIFTIDPITARDYDDAIHIKELQKINDKNTFEVGVHIADVSSFVMPSSPIDDEARWRTTTVYMPLKAYPMLPRILCDRLCSLRPNEEKLTFSVFLHINEDGEVLDSRFSKTVICSSFRFTYEDVDYILATNDNEDFSNQNLTDAYSRGVKIAPKVDSVIKEAQNRYKVETGEDMETWNVNISVPQWKHLCGNLKLLECLTQKIRYKRFENGSISLLRSEIKSTFDGKTPIGIKTESSSTSHELIEELMLLANIEVAKRLMASDPYKELALLRHHPSPNVKQLQTFINSHLNCECDLGSTKAIMATMILLGETMGSPIALAFCHLLTKAQEAAEYFIYTEGDSTHHYALRFPLYTHFTSPIRRYPDLIVHRILTAVLGLPNSKETNNFISDKEGRTMDCEKANTFRLKAKEANDYCQIAMFCVYLRSLNKLKRMLGIILLVQDRSLVVFLPGVGTEKRMYFDAAKSETRQIDTVDLQPRDKEQLQFPLEYQRRKNGITIVWEEGSREVSKSYSIMSPLPVYMLASTTTPVTLWIFPVSPLSDDYKTEFREEGMKEINPEVEKPAPGLDVSKAIRFVRAIKNSSVMR